MHVTELRLTNFRNIQSASLSFTPGLNALTGNNGQGKSNALEALYLCLAAKSHRERRPAAFIGPAGESARLWAYIEMQSGASHEVSVEFTAKRKYYTLDGEPVRSQAELAGLFPAVLFSPQDIEIVSGPPGARRAYLDGAISAASKNYALALGTYERALRQKSALLKAYAPSQESMLDVYDEALCESGSLLIRYRLQFLGLLKPRLLELYHQISGSAEGIEAAYLSQAVSGYHLRTVKERYAAMLKEARPEDLRYRIPAKGAHRDDVAFAIGGLEAARFASQGQQRSLALCLKLALCPVYKHLTGEAPVSLLDDALSELDEGRRGRALAAAAAGQSVWTMTDRAFLAGREADKAYTVAEGRFT